jgi:glycine/D-amino acid oxidase-like deaminating enzyme
MKTHARVVVIGGGINGCSDLYHLALKVAPERMKDIKIEEVIIGRHSVYKGK